MLHTEHVDFYLELFQEGYLVFNEKRVQLVEWLKRDILSKDNEYYFDDQQIEDYINFSERWYYPLDDWEKFLASFVFFYKRSNDTPVFRIFILVMGRGAGKNGFISTMAHFLASSLHGVGCWCVRP